MVRLDVSALPGQTHALAFLYSPSAIQKVTIESVPKKERRKKFVYFQIAPCTAWHVTLYSLRMDLCESCA